MRFVYLITFLIVYYNATEYELVVYNYEEKEELIEITCAEGVSREECLGPKTEERVEEKKVHRPYGSYYREFPYVFIY